MENYNRELRNMLGKYIEAGMACGLDLHESACSYAHVLYKLEITKDCYEKFYREYLISVMYLDAYKLLLYRHKVFLADDLDTEFLGLLFDIKDQDELLAEVSSNPEFLIRLIMESYKFKEMYGLAKVNIMKSLNQAENEWLLERFPIHQQDLDTYRVEITIDHILNSIQSQESHQVKDEFYSFRDAIMLNITGFICNLTNFDYANAERLLLEIAQKDYSASKFLVGFAAEREVCLDHIDLYENYSKRDILNELIANQGFLCDVIWNIAYVYVYQEYGGTKIHMEELDDCKDTEVMKKLKAK